MKKIFSTVVLAAAVGFACPGAVGEVPPLDLYLLIGQSNMAGRGKLTDENPLPSDGVWKLDRDDRWTVATEPLHFDKPVAGAGLGMSFARALRDKKPNVSIGLVPCAVGGTALERWMPGGDLYSNAVRRAKIAQANGTFKGILWHQGEADCETAQMRETYGTRLAATVKALRADLGTGDAVPFLAGELGPYLADRLAGSPHLVVNAQIKDCEKTVPNFRCVSAAGLTPNDDILHFDTESLRVFGRRYAEALAASDAAASDSVAHGGDQLRENGVRTISVAEFRDRMQGAWIGQSVGVSYGWPTEFRFKGALVPEEAMPVWKPETVNETFNQDDLYVEMTFLKTLLDKGVDVTPREAGIDFANSAYRLWCANDKARNNLRRGIAAPASSHPDYHGTPDDIDYQIESDFSGILAPGLPQAAVDLGETFGRIMNYGDGLYAGQFTGAMYAEAYFTKDRVEVVENALRAIPSESKYAGMVRDMLAWYRADPKNWKGAWRKAVDKYQAAENLGRVSFPAIDVKINGAMVLLGFLYGEGDMMKTAYIATCGGYDSDCNPSSACGVLGTMIGFKALDPKFHSALDKTNKWEFTDFTWDGLVAASECVARRLVVQYGGTVAKDAAGAEVFTLPVRPVRPSAFFDSRNPGPVPDDVRLTPAERARIRYLPCGKEGEPSVLAR